MDLVTLLNVSLKGINQMRRQLGLSQAALGRRTGRTQGTVANLLSSRANDIRLSSLVSLADGVEADVLIEVRPRCPIVCLTATTVEFRCPCSKRIAGARGEVSAIWNPSKRRWGLWTTQGVSFGLSVDSHVAGCMIARDRMLVEYC